MRTIPRVAFELLAPSAVGGFVFACLSSIGAHSIGDFLLGSLASVVLATRACIVQSVCCTVLIELAYWKGLKPGSAVSIAAYICLAMLSSASLVLIYEPSDWTTALVFGAIGGTVGLFLGLAVRWCQRRTDAKALKETLI